MASPDGAVWQAHGESQWRPSSVDLRGLCSYEGYDPKSEGKLKEEIAKVLYNNMIKSDEGETSLRWIGVHRGREVACRLNIARASRAGCMRTHWRVRVLCYVVYSTLCVCFVMWYMAHCVCVVLCGICHTLCVVLCGIWHTVCVLCYLVYGTQRHSSTNYIKKNRS
jgi:hypothetical protein